MPGRPPDLSRGDFVDYLQLLHLESNRTTYTISCLIHLLRQPLPVCHSPAQSGILSWLKELNIFISPRNVDSLQESTYDCMQYCPYKRNPPLKKWGTHVSFQTISEYLPKIIWYLVTGLARDGVESVTCHNGMPSQSSGHTACAARPDNKANR